ncbi:MAG: carbon-nitrogen hydrolase family protein [Blastocatellia bacterium]
MPIQRGRNRIVRVVTVSQDQLERESGDLLERTIARLNQAASFQPDIACLPELFSNRPPEPVPGPLSVRLSEWAREHSSYLIFGLKTRINGRVSNSTVLIDRKGRIIGQYNKIHPTEGELQEGIQPGDVEPVVFETDFGTIGIQICFYVNWGDVWKRLKQKGVKIVFFPSAYPAARQLSALALMNQYYVVSSTMRGSSRIYDISGEVVASSGHYQQWAGAALPLGKRLFEIDYHLDKVREIQRKYGSKVEVTWFHDDSWFTLASLDPDLATEDVISVFGLTPLDDYRARATTAINKMRAGAQIPRARRRLSGAGPQRR